MKKILLCGYMGSGKSTVGEILAKKANMEFVDLDAVIENSSGSKISDIFSARGEIYFRKLERELLVNLMESGRSIVLALGGGTPVYSNNHLFFKGEGVTSFYLKASIETLSERLADQTSSRPIVAGKSTEEIRDIIAKQLFERNYYYHHATHIIAVDDKLPETIAANIIEKLA